MNGKKALSLILCLCLVVTSFAGCGMQSNASNDLVGMSTGGEATPVVSFVDDDKVNYETNFVTGNVTEDEKTDGIINAIDKNLAKDDEKDDVVNSDGELTVPFDQAYPDVFNSEDIEYADNSILIKIPTAFSDKTAEGLKAAGIGKMESMFSLDEYTWYTSYLLKGVDVNAAMEKVRQVEGVKIAEYNFKYETALAEDESVAEAEVKDNPKYGDQWARKKFGIREAWDKHHEKHNTGGGSSSVVVAVIDTGVDYNHVDLKANMWVNSKEVPDNDIDDDGNGKVDDYYGYNATADRGSAMDDHGHGTHVAGIVAASNNKEGIVGFAYNSKIMAIKAGDASGYFLQDNIAEAIIYAYENGADVINMSFGGSAASIAVQDALTVAYTRCVLVASAGNDGMPNQATDYYPMPLPNYPAALSYVLGVMSVGETNVESSFTNWDAILYNSTEYEVYAPGERIMSTLPGDKYGSLSGTSMAAPVVAAQAALLRSYYDDYDKYPTKFIYGQIVGTAEHTVACNNPDKHTVNGYLHNVPGVVNFYASMTELPTPDIGMSDYTLFDTEVFEADKKGLTEGSAEYNNGDGIVDSGEIIALGFTLKNRWGMSENTKVHLDATNDLGVTNPYVTFLNNDINYKSVGTYSENDSGKLYSEDGDMWTGWENPFYVKISKDCPNDYTVTIDLTITYENGLDSSDNTLYTTEEQIVLKVRRGTILPNKVTEDMTLTKDNYYIIPNAMLIAEGATVTVEEGTKIQFWTDDPNDSYADTAITYLKVDGKFICNGTEEEPVELFPSGWMDRYRVEITSTEKGWVSLNYTNVTNPFVDIDEANNCVFSQNYKDRISYRKLENGEVRTYRGVMHIDINEAYGSAFYKLGGRYINEEANLAGVYDTCIFVDSRIKFNYGLVANKCVFYGNNNYWGEDPNKDGTGGPSSIKLHGSVDNVQVEQVFRNNETGKTYIVLSGDQYSNAISYFANSLGGELVQFNTKAEFDYVTSQIAEDRGYLCGFKIKDKVAYNLDDNKMVLGEAAYAIDKGRHCILYDQSISEDDYYYDGKDISLFGINYLYQVERSIIEVPGTVYITDIKLDDYLVDIDLDTTYQIGATVTPITADETTLVYESQDENVVKVDSNGKVTPVAEGTTTVRVYAPDYAVYNYITINVKAPVELESLTFESEEIVIPVDTNKKANLIFNPKNTTKKNVSYSSSNETVATINEKGVIIAKSVGQTEITVTGYNGLSDTLVVNVVVPATSMAFEEDIYVTDFEKEDGTEFYPVILPTNTTDKSLTWESSNPEICYVDEEGKLVKLAEGTAVLKATLNNTELSDTVTVKVKAGDASVNVVNVKKYDKSTFALLEDGTLWVWNTQYNYPTKINISNVKDFAVYGSGIYILDNEGVLKKYSSEWYQSTQVNDYRTIEEETNFKPLENIESLSSEYQKGNGAHFAITKDGAVWAWGINYNGLLGDGTSISRETPVLINIPEPVKDVVTQGFYTTAFLTESGNVYFAGKPGEPTKCYSGVKSVEYIQYNSLMLLNFDTYSKWIEAENLGETNYYELQKPNEKVLGQHAIYNEGGSYFIRTVGGLSSPCANNFWTPLQKINSVKEFFDLGDNLYIETTDNMFYSIGSGSDYALGTGNTVDTKIPSRVYFGFRETNVELTLSTWNGTEDAGIFNLKDNSIQLDFSNGINGGNSYSYISIKDSNGRPVTFAKSMELDKLILTPHVELASGETYTLTIPAGALTAANSDCTNEEIVLTFTYTGDDASEETPDNNEPGGDSVIDEEPINEAVVDQDKFNQRHFWTSEEVMEYWNEFVASGNNTKIHSNAILNRLNDDNVATWLRFTSVEGSTDQVIGLGGNYWGTTNKDLVNKQILDFDDYQHLVDINEGEILTEAPEDTFPFVVDAYLELDGEVVDTVGNDLVTFVVEFNRDMDTSIPLDVRFGSAYPYADYQVEGEYVTPRVWKGEMQLTTIIENGYQYWSVTNGKAAGTSFKLYTDWGRFPFKIDTTAAQALIMQSEVTDKGINLTWTQDDFDTLAGYNVYRSTEEDGLYTKINRTVIPADIKEWFDDTVLPGQRYYYNFTVVQSDMTESEPSGKVMATAMDTMAPDIYHSPVYHAFTGNNLVISATVTDNVAITGAKLYYRTAGTEEWKTKQMTNNNDKYSAVIPANDITVDGLEYYIEATDGISKTYKGTAERPYEITVQVAVTASQKGDVNGDGAVTLQDAMMLLYSINDKYNMTEEEFARADLDDNGILEAKEALRILQYVNGTVGSVLP